MEDKGFLTMKSKLVTFYFYQQFADFHCYFLKEKIAGIFGSF